MGTVFEKAFNKFAKTNGALPFREGEDIEKHQMLADHETDTLFRFPFDTIYCFENKTGAGVDTEKTQKTKAKLTEWETELAKNNNNVICKVLTAGSPTGAAVKNLKKPLLAADVFGYQEFFQIFHVNVLEDDWNQLLRELGQIVSTALSW
jgi:hypothetical protein